MQSKLATATKQNTKLAETIKELQQKLKNLPSTIISQATTDLALSNEKVQNLKQTISLMKENDQLKVKTLADLRKNLADLRSTKTAQQKSIKDLEKKVKDLAKVVKDGQTEKDRLSAIIQKHNDKKIEAAAFQAICDVKKSEAAVAKEREKRISKVAETANRIAVERTKSRLRAKAKKEDEERKASAKKQEADDYYNRIALHANVYGKNGKPLVFDKHSGQFGKMNSPINADGPCLAMGLAHYKKAENERMANEEEKASEEVPEEEKKLPA